MVRYLTHTHTQLNGLWIIDVCNIRILNLEFFNGGLKNKCHFKDFNEITELFFCEKSYLNWSLFKIELFIHLKTGQEGIF